VTVVDASVWVSRILPQDAHHSISQIWLEQHLASDLVVAPALLLAEVAGAISRRTASPRLARRVTDSLLALPGLQLVAVDSQLGVAAARLAADLRLRGADAIYVALARHLQLTLVTWDDEQAERGGRVVDVQSPRAG
jgi:predicted nucleic acid-binding protein